MAEIPKTNSQFLAAIEARGRMGFWRVCDVRSDAEDDTCARTVMFAPIASIVQDEQGAPIFAGYVACEYGRMLVSLNQGFTDDPRNWYWFELERIQRDLWLNSHVSCKTWFTPRHQLFMAELLTILPEPVATKTTLTKGKHAVA